MRISNVLLALAAATLLASGCAQNRGPANQALDQIEASLKDVRDDAAKYAPDGLKGVEAQFKRLRESYEAKEYDNVLAGTPALEKAVASLKDAVDAGKAQARQAVAAAKSEWEGLNAEVPKMVDTIQARVDTLAQGRLPFGLNKDEFEGAKSAFESMKETWKDATAQARQGDAIEATHKGKTAKGMGEAIYDQLKIKQT
jgi:HAMP domain-containing protein